MIRLAGLIALFFLLSGFSAFNISQVKDCEVEQVYQWVKHQRVRWMFKTPNIITIGKKAILRGESHDIIGYREDVGHYSGLYHHRTGFAEFLDGDTVVLAHEIAHAFGADEGTAEKIHREFEQQFVMRKCIDKSV